MWVESGRNSGLNVDSIFGVVKISASGSKVKNSDVEKEVEGVEDRISTRLGLKELGLGGL